MIPSLVIQKKIFDWIDFAKDRVEIILSYWKKVEALVFVHRFCFKFWFLITAYSLIWFILAYNYKLIHKSDYKGMNISLDLGLFVLWKGTMRSLKLKPALLYHAHLTLVRFAIITNKVSTFISSNSLPVDLFAAYPTQVLPLQLFTNDISKFF